MGTGVRREPDAESERLLRRYFGGKTCVVDGSDDAQWHHIDDDASRHGFEDFVPLSAGWNTALRDAHVRARKAGVTWVPADVVPGRLMNLAELSHAGWCDSRAYGLSRLAHQVGRRYVGMSTDELLLCSARTLRYLRHRPDYRLIHDVVVRDVLTLTESAPRIGPTAASRMLFELACLCSENGDARGAHTMHRVLARRIRPRWDGDGWCANARRRSDIVVALLQDTPRQAVARLRRAALRAPANVGIQIGTDVYAAARWFDAGEESKARDLLEPHRDLIVSAMETYADPAVSLSGTERPPLNVSPAAHFMQMYALVHHATERRGQGRRSRELAAVATRSLERSGALLNQEVPFSWRRAVGADVRQCGPLPRATRAAVDRAAGRLVGALGATRENVGDSSGDDRISR